MLRAPGGRFLERFKVFQGVRGALQRIKLDEQHFRPAPAVHALLTGFDSPMTDASSSTQSARRSAAMAAHSPACVRTTSPPCRSVPSSSARASIPPLSTTCCSAPQPGWRGQPQRRANGAPARGNPGERSGTDREPPLRIRAPGDRQRFAGDQERRRKLLHRGRRGEHVARALGDAQARDRLSSRRARRGRHHPRMALSQLEISGRVADLDGRDGGRGREAVPHLARGSGRLRRRESAAHGAAGSGEKIR